MMMEKKGKLVCTIQFNLLNVWCLIDSFIISVRILILNGRVLLEFVDIFG